VQKQSSRARSESLLSAGFKMRAGPDGLHFFDRHTGANVLLDEIEVSSEFWSSAPRQVSIALTNACELDCEFCYAPKTRASLSSEQILGWLRELDSNDCFGVGFGGGEPTLHPDLIEICQFATKATSLAVTLTTHAHRINDELAEALTGNVHFVRVSMDGVGATYETIRKRPFASFCERLQRVRRMSRFGINFVVNARTLPDLDAATSLAADLGATEFLLLPQRPVRDVVGIDEDTAGAFVRWVEEYRGVVPLLTSEPGTDGIAICNPLPHETGLRAYVHVAASGELRRTSFDDFGIKIGSEGVMKALRLLSASEPRGPV
jgi:hypothetical protein